MAVSLIPVNHRPQLLDHGRHDRTVCGACRFIQLLSRNHLGFCSRRIRFSLFPVSFSPRLSSGSVSAQVFLPSSPAVSRIMSSLLSRLAVSLVSSLAGSCAAGRQALSCPDPHPAQRQHPPPLSPVPREASLAARANSLKNKLFFLIVSFLSGASRPQPLLESKIATCFPARPRVTTAIRFPGSHAANRFHLRFPYSCTHNRS